MLAFIGINAVVEKKFHYLTDGKAFTASNSFYLLYNNIITDEGKVFLRLTRRFVG